MPEHWMGWAQVIGTFTGATVLAFVVGWKIWTGYIQPWMKGLKDEITGPGSEPGLRSLVSEATHAANTAARGVQLANEQLHEIRSESQDNRRRLDGVEAGLQEVRAEVRDTAERQGRRMGEIQEEQARILGIVLGKQSSEPSVAEGSQVRAGAGADAEEILDPQPPRPRSV
jgi:hypothetical protein